MNPADMLKMMKAKATFQENHPKFMMFLRAVYKRALQEGSVIDITVTTPEGEKISSNIRVKASDMEILEELLKKMQP